MLQRISRLSYILLCGCVLLATFTYRTVCADEAVALTVTSTADGTDANPGNGVCETVAGNGICTLRAAIMETNAQPGLDVIVLPEGVYTLLLPGATEDAGASGDLDITNDLRITGVSSATTIIDANQIDRIFDVISENIRVEVEDITMRNGFVQTTLEDGAAVYNRGNFILRRSMVASNHVDFTLSPYYGMSGAIYNLAGTVQIEQSVVAQNAPNGIMNHDQLIVLNSQFTHNQGYAIISRDRPYSLVQPRVTLSNSIIQENQGGVSAYNILTIQNSQILHNHGPAVVVSAPTSRGRTAIRTSLLSNNLVGIDSVGELHIDSTSVINNSGSGIRHDGILAIQGSTIAQNSETGIEAQGSVRIQNSFVLSNSVSGIRLKSSSSRGSFATIAYTLIQGNRTPTNGGGIQNNSRLILDHVVIRDNRSDQYGGGIYSSKRILIRESTISHNLASHGGGIYSSGDTLLLINSTLSSNRALNGGGLFEEGVWMHNMQFGNVTVANNIAEQIGGGLYVVTGTLHLQNSIIAMNQSATNQGNDCYIGQALASKGYNLIQDLTNCAISGVTTGNLLGVDAKLEPLQDNSGQGWTHALLSDSPAIDAGNPNGCVDELDKPLLLDQRGYLRAVAGNPISSTRCDIGAVEAGDRRPLRAYMPMIASSSSAVLIVPPTRMQVAKAGSVVGIGVTLGIVFLLVLLVIFWADLEEEPSADGPEPTTATPEAS